MQKIVSIITMITVVLISCAHNVDIPQSNNSNGSNSTVITGNFTITKFTDDNLSEDKTANFSGYIFSFTNDGKILAIKNDVTVQGSYSEKPSHEGEAAKLTINFSDEPLSDLNKSWQIDLVSDGAIHLSDDDNVNEVLEFTVQ